MKTVVVILFSILLSSCGLEQKESTQAIERQNLDSIQSVVLTKADSNVLAAEIALQLDSSEENFIWLGRRLGYVNRMEDAIDVLTTGIIRYPNSWKLLRFRGHRYISTRQFTLAIIDLQRAANIMSGKPLEIEPDGIPNKINKPLSTYQYNVWYHLGLSFYYIGDMARAEESFERCLALSNNDDLLVASSDWLYMIYRRMNDRRSAKEILDKVKEGMNIVENDAYYKRLLMYQGKLSPDAVLLSDPQSKDYDLNLATQGYGVGNYFYFSGEPDRAREIFKKVISGKSIYSFGFIAAEIDLARLWKNP